MRLMSGGPTGIRTLDTQIRRLVGVKFMPVRIQPLTQIDIKSVQSQNEKGSVEGPFSFCRHRVRFCWLRRSRVDGSHDIRRL